MFLMSTSHDDTLLIHAGRAPAGFGGLVNTPACRASTLLVDSYDDWRRSRSGGNPYGHYARFGTPTTRAFADMLAELENAHGAIVFPSGLAACTHALLAFLAPGDHVLMTDNVYGPTRTFACATLARLGVEVTFFAPLEGADIASRLRANTRVVYVESPGSQTFEVGDIPAIAAAAHRQGAIVMMDNTWATPLYFKPFEHGVDVSIHAATKYLVGHSDAILGAATANARAWPTLQAGAHDFGQTAGPDDLYLALRGLRTLSVRLQRHQETALLLAQRLQCHPAVSQVLHPALPEAAGHACWKRDFKGASGLFGVVLKPMAEQEHALARAFDSLQLFGIGLSWGGYESLALPVDAPLRTTAPWQARGPLLRLHAGLEDPECLWRDLSSALDAYVHAAEPALS
ncbi:cystathionine beta-lyase [Pusillimonas caeni]|nr:cystathionine beta-lyase [Pusillimonas caeni]TFL15036.1 cystathionine beta-lyase [Pusillimonas caeni]